MPSSCSLPTSDQPWNPSKDPSIYPFLLSLALPCRCAGCGTLVSQPWIKSRTLNRESVESQLLDRQGITSTHFCPPHPPTFVPATFTHNQTTTMPCMLAGSPLPTNALCLFLSLLCALEARPVCTGGTSPRSLPSGFQRGTHKRWGWEESEFRLPSPVPAS